jgi:hypothetical protein
MPGDLVVDVAEISQRSAVEGCFPASVVHPVPFHFGKARLHNPTRASLSLVSGRFRRQPASVTVADGLRTQLTDECRLLPVIFMKE